MPAQDQRNDREAISDRREDQADTRESTADRREQHADIREGVLELWEREVTERARSVDFYDEADETPRDVARRRRDDAHRQRRTEAEGRRVDAIERGIDRVARIDTDADSTDAGGPHVEAQAQRTLDRLEALVDSAGTLTSTVRTIVAIASDAFPDAEAVTMSMTVDGRLQPAASTTSWAGDLDAVQLRDEVGPIIDAVEQCTVVVSGDLAADDRWGLAASVGSVGNRAVLSAAIVVGQDAAGALTMYAEPGRGFDRQAELTVALLAAEASLAIGWSLDRRAHRARTEAWERALSSRDQIGQAKGILMQLMDLTADDAFELMRDTSQHHNTKIRDIAEHVVAHRRLPGSPTPKPAQISTGPNAAG